MSTERLVHVELDEKSLSAARPETDHERAVAIYDLLEENHFAPVGEFEGPYNLLLSTADNRLILDIRNEAGDPLTKVGLALSSFKKIVSEYAMICDSYHAAIKKSSPSQIETIDMGRRGLHNDGSELLRDLLAPKVEIDFQTARRLFTLLCVLHIRG